MDSKRIEFITHDLKYLVRRWLKSIVYCDCVISDRVFIQYFLVVVIRFLFVYSNMRLACDHILFEDSNRFCGPDLTRKTVNYLRTTNLTVFNHDGFVFRLLFILQTRQLHKNNIYRRVVYVQELHFDSVLCGMHCKYSYLKN